MSELEIEFNDWVKDKSILIGRQANNIEQVKQWCYLGKKDKFNLFIDTKKTNKTTEIC